MNQRQGNFTSVTWHGHLAREDRAEHLVFAALGPWARCPCHLVGPQRNRLTPRRAFTLIELLIVIAIIAMITSILAPSIMNVKDKAESAVCLNNLHSLSTGMHTYHMENNDRFWPYLLANRPKPGVKCYWWGTDTDPVDVWASPYMEALGGVRGLLWCPSLEWGSYVPQGSVSEPTTTYAYNMYMLDPDAWTPDPNFERKTTALHNISKPAYLFVFNDSAMFWAAGGTTNILQNSSYLEPVTGNPIQTPTSHFRHSGKTNAMTAGGHAGSYGPAGWDVDPTHNLGFVGTENYPHYVQ